MTRLGLDPVALRRHRARNLLQSALLLAFMTLHASVVGYLVWGGSGLWLMPVWLVLAGLVGTGGAWRWQLRLVGARPVPVAAAPRTYAVLRVLAQRAGLEVVPRLWWMASPMANAFAMGSRADAAITVTQGLVDTLDEEERIAVLAHEIAHVAHGDLFVMGLADAISRLTGILGWMGLAGLVVSLPYGLAGGEVPWLAWLLIACSPQVSLLAQLGLSRSREFDADLTAATLTGHPEALASALRKLERAERGWRRLLFPGRSTPEPSWLRTHPATEERVARLLALRVPSRDPWDLALGLGAWGRW